MDLDEEAVNKALDGLKKQGLAGAIGTADSRVTKI
jgi:hypothetical protein